jgi:hypothetical protein
MQAKPCCAVERCPKPAKTRGWCSAHYERWRRNGEPGPAGDARRRPKRPCSVEGCVGPPVGYGWCGKHYRRWRVYGDPAHLIRKTYGTKRRVRSDGYIEVYLPDHPLAACHGYVPEHRLVAWEAGLLTIRDRHLHVHHKNEIKTDNRIENLEVKRDVDHGRDHIAERGYVVNQFGTWPLKAS